MWLKAPNISATHGFSTRHGGVSKAPFDSLNLGGSDDEPVNIESNRKIALRELGLSVNRLSILKQVHGNNVIIGGCGTSTADGQVSNEKGIILVVQAADCYPILFHDPVGKVIGAAHAGWRGTVSGVAHNTISKMVELGSDPSDIQIAIGPGISQKNFEVGEEVINQFLDSGFPPSIIQGRNIDLIEANCFKLIRAGIKKENIYVLNRDTFDSEFFSYRRDKGLTGRMWGLIAL